MKTGPFHVVRDSAAPTLADLQLAIKVEATRQIEVLIANLTADLARAKAIAESEAYAPGVREECRQLALTLPNVIARLEKLGRL